MRFRTLKYLLPLTCLGLGFATISSAPGPVALAAANELGRGVYRCDRAGEAPLFASVPCDEDSGPGAQLGRGVVQAPDRFRLPQPGAAQKPANLPDSGELTGAADPAAGTPQQH